MDDSTGHLQCPFCGAYEVDRLFIGSLGVDSCTCQGCGARWDEDAVDRPLPWPRQRRVRPGPPQALSAANPGCPRHAPSWATLWLAGTHNAS